eukprot:CCRYP_019170-RB/>CCRYP_019170-RB protein AED:0.42 eAED:0.65 QI:217/0/0.33/1/0/0/3/0/67
MKMLMKSLRKKIPRNSSGGFVLFFGGKHKIPVLVTNTDSPPLHDNLLHLGGAVCLTLYLLTLTLFLT